MVTTETTKSYTVLWWAIFCVLPLFFLGPKAAVDIQQHDTYFVIGATHIAITLALFLGALGAVYWLMRNYKINQTLWMLHAFVTVCSTLGIVIIICLKFFVAQDNFKLETSLNQIGKIFVLILFLIQIVFAINICIGLIKGKLTK